MFIESQTEALEAFCCYLDNLTMTLPAYRVREVCKLLRTRGEGGLASELEEVATRGNDVRPPYRCVRDAVKFLGYRSAVF